MILKPTEERIYELLKSNDLYRNEKGIYTVFPQKLLIEKSGKSESTVQRALRGLEEQGYINRELLQEENLMLYYFPNEDFTGRHIHNRFENDTPSTDSEEKMTPPPQFVEKNDTPSTDGEEKSDTRSTKVTRTFYCTEGSREAITITENVGLVVKNFVQQNSPVNNEMIRNSVMNDLYSAEINGQMKMLPTVVREQHGKSEQVISYVSFCYDDNVDLEILNNKGRFNITAYDRRVYNAVSTLFLNERKTVSMSEIFSVMTGYARANPTQSQLDTIEKSLEKLRRVRVYIDLTEEVKHKMIRDKQPLIDAGILKNHSDKIKKAVIEDNMLHLRRGETVSEKGKIFKSVQIIDEPTLLTYNRAKKTLITIPIEYIGLEGQSTTDKTIAFQDYLLMRIFGYKNRKLHENKILYDTLYRDAGYEKPEDSKGFIRDRETIVKMMEQWKRKGLITEFFEVKEGRSYTGLVFYTALAPRIE